MLSAQMVVVISLAALPPASAAAESRQASSLTIYREARARLGPDAGAHLRMALWCETHGLETERVKHLALAVLLDPAHATARGLLGLVSFRGRWQSPEAIRETLQADLPSEHVRAEYNARRDRMGSSADAHWKMATWCEQQGLRPEATAHLTVVTQLDPARDAAWKHLGFKKQGKHWVTDAQLAALKAESEERRAAGKSWTTLLVKLRDALQEKSRHAETTKALQTITDPLAVPSVWAVFATGDEARQKVAVQILGQIDAPASSRALALLAIASESPGVRGRAVEMLRRRDPREITSYLVDLLRDPDADPDPILYHYLVQPIGWEAIGSPGFVLVRGPRYEILRTYTVDESRTYSAFTAESVLSPNQIYGYAARVMQQRQRQVLDVASFVRLVLSDSVSDVLAARLRVRQVSEVNARITGLLSVVTGIGSGKDTEYWRKWWADERGYAYESPPPRPRQDLTLLGPTPTYSDNVHYSCFAAGTPVHALTGLRTIESVQIGDQVLTADPRTGSLTYQPVLAAVQNKPAMVLNITLDGEVVRATGIHRFWKAGHGWTMARDLKRGELIRSIGGVVEVRSVASDRTEPVYNLVVMDAHSFFVGDRGTLVHDNSLVQPVLRPFDAVPDLAELMSESPKRRE